MQQEFTASAQEALRIAKKISKDLGHGYVGSEHILLGLLMEPEGAAGIVLHESGVDKEYLIELIEKLIAPNTTAVQTKERNYTPRAIKIIEESKKEALRFSSKMVGTEHLLIAIIRDASCVATRVLYTMKINIQKMYTDLLKAIGADIGLVKEDFQNGKPVSKKAVATTTLDQYSRDLTNIAREGGLDPVVGRDDQINRIMQILSRRTKNNPCLIGEPGVGKTAIVEGLAQRIVLGLVPKSLQDKRVVTLDLSGMVAGSKYRGEFEDRIKKVLKEVMDDGNVLLFLDELHTIIGAGGAEGAIDASNILKPSLARGEIQLIGATTIEEYRKYIEKDAALERRFQPITVEEPSIEDTVEILKGLRSKYEDHHGVVISDEALESAANLSERYINDRFLPDKAIDLMDEAAAKLQLKGYKMPANIEELEKRIQELEGFIEKSIIEQEFSLATEYKEEKENLENKRERLLKRFQKNNQGKTLTVVESHIAEVVSDWTKIPVSKLEEAESARLKRLEKTLHQRVVGQNEAVSAVAKAVKRGRVGLKDPNRPIGSFLFLGPTGVGKTELSKALAESVFGEESAMIRVDMSEYMEKHSVSKLIGSPPGYVGYEEGGQLSEKVRRHPYSVILFDEIEKAHPDVFNILLQVLDDGHITDSRGRKVDFKNTILIMTSNAGAASIMSPKHLGFGVTEDEKATYDHMKSGVMDEVKRMFKPEFINRIDEIIVFHSLTKTDIKKIVTIMLKEFVKRCKEQMNIEFVIRDSVKNYIFEVGYDEKYGARPLKRAIQSKIEDQMAEEILDGKIHSGDTVKIGVSNKEIKFYVNDDK
ncbi:MAG TPA: ATP-dependent Clp protease ATP-binding subunit [Candidatus Merdenecus merdavium]|nr:ATP-dependent Clp protease ATP-binding subunit [Candidatus Merdenecus merdavium]